jgi:hypothetical protein
LTRLCDRNCAFVNFTNISNAIKAIDGVKNKPEYANLRIAHGKDRCANPPRSGAQGASGGGGRRNASGYGPTSGLVLTDEEVEAVGMKMGDASADGGVHYSMERGLDVGMSPGVVGSDMSFDTQSPAAAVMASG